MRRDDAPVSYTHLDVYKRQGYTVQLYEPDGNRSICPAGHTGNRYRGDYLAGLLYAQTRKGNRLIMEYASFERKIRLKRKNNRAKMK